MGFVIRIRKEKRIIPNPTPGPPQMKYAFGEGRHNPPFGDRRGHDSIRVSKRKRIFLVSPPALRLRSLVPAARVQAGQAPLPCRVQVQMEVCIWRGEKEQCRSTTKSPRHKNPKDFCKRFVVLCLGGNNILGFITKSGN
jgi:hypothetical protein